MTTPVPQPQEPTCTIMCPAIRDDDGIWYCRIMKAYVAPLEHHFDYGFDIIRDGKVVHSGYSTPCDALELFRSRPHTPEQDTDRHDPRIELRRVCEQEEREAAIRNAVLDECLLRLIDQAVIIDGTTKFVIFPRHAISNTIDSLRSTPTPKAGE